MDMTYECVVVYMSNANILKTEQRDIDVRRKDLVPHWPLVSFVCEGSGLDDQHFSEIIGITLTKEQNRWGATKRALASVYTKDGTMIGKDATSDMFVNGQWDKAAILSSRLSLLMPLASLETDVTYMCQVSALPKNGSLEGLDSLLEITEEDLKRLTPEPTTPPPTTTTTTTTTTTRTTTTTTPSTTGTSSSSSSHSNLKNRGPVTRKGATASSQQQIADRKLEDATSSRAKPAATSSKEEAGKFSSSNANTIIWRAPVLLILAVTWIVL